MMPLQKILSIWLTILIVFCSFTLTVKAKSNTLSEKQIEELNKQFKTALSQAISITNGKSSLPFSLEALHIACELNDDFNIAQSYIEISHDYEKMGDLSNALQYVIMAAKKYEAIGKKEETGMVYNRIGSIYLLQGNQNLAISYMAKAMALHREMGADKSYADDLNNLGEIYRLKKQFGNALNCFVKADSIFFQKKDTISYAYVLGNIGLVYAARNQMDSANYFLSEASNILHQKKDFYPVTIYLIETANIYFERGNIEEALKKANEALNISARENFREQLRDVNKLLSEIYVQEQDYKNAYTALNEYYHSKDSLSNNKIIGDMAEMRADYEVSKKETEIKGLQAINQLRNRINIGLGAGFLLVTLLTIILIRLNKKVSLANHLLSVQKKELEQKNEIIRISLIEKETLLKEIHHRVKNNLQIISSLLNLQSLHVKDKKAIEAFEESQRRLHSIALVHQKLYQNDNFANINIKEYIGDMIASIHQLFHLKAKNIHYQLNIADVNLNIDTSVPLGLIINELVTNAFKYAFNKVSEGIISINLDKKDEHSFRLIVKDNGPGLPENLKIEESESLGLKLVGILIRQLEGTIEIRSNDGAEFCMNFIEISQFKN